MGEEKEEEERGGALEVGGASVAGVRQTEREAVEAGILSRAKGGRAIEIDAGRRTNSPRAKVIL